MNALGLRCGMSAANLVGLNALWLRANRPWPLALAYHGVTSNVGREFTDENRLTSESFDTQLAWLERHCEVVDLPDYLDAVRKPWKRKKRIVTITFDDGYENNLTCAVPILEAHGLSACFFLTAEPILTGCWFTHDLLSLSVRFSHEPWEAQVGHEKWFIRAEAAAAERRRIEYEMRRAVYSFSWQEVTRLVRECYQRAGRPEPPKEYAEFYRPLSVTQAQELLSRGMYVGSHTVTHPKLAELSDDDMQRELCNAAEWIEGAFGVPIHEQAIAYPKGSYDSRCLEYCRQLGHCAGFAWGGSWRPIDDRILDLPRMGVSCEDSINMFAGKVSGLWSTLGQVRRLAGFKK